MSYPKIILYSVFCIFSLKLHAQYVTPHGIRLSYSVGLTNPVGDTFYQDGNFISQGFFSNLKTGLYTDLHLQHRVGQSIFVGLGYAFQNFPVWKSSQRLTKYENSSVLIHAIRLPISLSVKQSRTGFWNQNQLLLTLSPNLNSLNTRFDTPIFMSAYTERPITSSQETTLSLLGEIVLTHFITHRWGFSLGGSFEYMWHDHDIYIETHSQFWRAKIGLTHQLFPLNKYYE